MEKLRLVRLWLGGLLVAVWVAACLFLLAGLAVGSCVGSYYPDCGDVGRGLFFMGVAVSPLALVGLPLLASGLPRRRGDGGGIRGMRVLFRLACFAIASVFALLGVFLGANLGNGIDAAVFPLGLGACAAASLWAGVRAGR